MGAPRERSAMSHTGRRTASRHVASARRRAWLLGGVSLAIVAAAVVVGFEPAAPAGLDDQGDPVLGEGPVTVYSFADFQCPYCREFELTRFDALAREGVARFVFKDLPVVGDDSWTAAEASQQVWQDSPEAYWA